MERTKLKAGKSISLALKLVLAIGIMASVMLVAQSQDLTVPRVSRGDGHREVDFDDSTVKDENKKRSVTVPVVGKIVSISAIGNDEGSIWGITSGGIGSGSVTFTGLQKPDREAKKYTPYFSGTAIEDGNGIGIKPIAPYPWDVAANYNIISIIGDTNRDGKVEMDDEKDKTTWTKEHGAIIYYGQGKKKGDKYNLDDPNIATFIIRKCPAVAEGAKLYLKCTVSDKIAIFKPSATTPIDFIAGKWEVPGDIAGGDMTFRIISLVPTTAPSFNEFTLTLTLERKGKITNDSIAVRVAPILLSWNGQDVEKFYAPTPDIWKQDIMELGYSQIQLKDNKYGHILIDLDDQDRQYIYNKIITVDKFWQVLVESNGGNGGNIEVTPPTDKNKFGLIIHGTGKAYSLKSFFESQKLQVPAVLLNTKWLHVGHVDEVVSFVRNTRFMLASPVKAFTVFQREYENNNMNETIKLGIDGGGDFVSEEKNYTIEEILVHKNSQGAYVEGELAYGIKNKNVTRFILKSGHSFNATTDVNQFIRIDDEIMYALSISGNSVDVIRASSKRSS